MIIFWVWYIIQLNQRLFAVIICALVTPLIIIFLSEVFYLSRSYAVFKTNKLTKNLLQFGLNESFDILLRFLQLICIGIYNTYKTLWLSSVSNWSVRYGFLRFCLAASVQIGQSVYFATDSILLLCTFYFCHFQSFIRLIKKFE